MKIRHFALSASVVVMAGLGVAYAQTKPVSARPNAMVYKSPT